METDCEMPICSQIGDIQQIKKDTSSNNTLLTEIKNFLLGNEFNKNGMVQRMEKYESDMRSIKGKILYFSGISAGVGATLGFVIGKIWK
jgi:hypothetical protein